MSTSQRRMGMLLEGNETSCVDLGWQTSALGIAYLEDGNHLLRLETNSTWCFKNMSMAQNIGRVRWLIAVAMLLMSVFCSTPQGPRRTKSHPLIIGPTGPLDKLLGRFWIWKRFWEGIAIGYKSGAGYYRPKLFVNPSRPNTNKVHHPLILL
jgi:hypothetical protein